MLFFGEAVYFSTMAKKKKSKSTSLMGRDPAMGRVAFKTGSVLTRKDKSRNRKGKYGKRNLRRDLDNG